MTDRPGQMSMEVRPASEIERSDRIAQFTGHMNEDWRHPGRKTRLKRGDGTWDKGTRCLRCGKAIMPFDRIIGHDLGWCGCYGIDPVCFQYIEDRAERERAFFARADREVFPDCAACGHPWGLHLGQHAGSFLPNEHGCDYCLSHCRRYIRPPEAETPWGTCPGCWSVRPACVCLQ